MKSNAKIIFWTILFLNCHIQAQYDPKLDSIPWFDTCFVPTYDGSNEAVHPDVIYFKDGFTIQDSTIHFLMVMTPYPNFSRELENPSVVYSCDGYHFYEWPQIHTNPLAFPNGSYNNDPDMIWDAEYESLYIIYQETESSKKWQDIKLLTNDSTISNNTLPRTILHYQADTSQTWKDSIFTVSPSLLPYSDTLFMFYVHLMNTSSEKKEDADWTSSRIEILKSTEGIHQWNKDDTIHAILHDKPAGLFIWHINVFDGQDGWFYMLCNGYEGSFWNNHNLYIARSTNLLDWYFFDDPILIENDPFFNNDCMGVYRSSGLINK
ncbi:hypothetical protein JXL83_04080, partial [candidate division WOR-3 bacterium]|nr:hypothetical protein [candidate division WOR-3 bacterium]